MAFLRTGPSTSRPEVGTDQGQQGLVLHTLPTREVDGCLYAIVDQAERRG